MDNNFGDEPSRTDSTVRFGSGKKPVNRPRGGVRSRLRPQADSDRCRPVGPTLQDGMHR